jgi:chorismate mutase / prephenate dehydratase
VIQIIGEMGCNMVSIKSRPMPHMTWEYYFYTELIGSSSDSEKLTAALEPVCTSVRTLGIYGKA